MTSKARSDEITNKKTSELIQEFPEAYRLSQDKNIDIGANWSDVFTTEEAIAYFELKKRDEQYEIRRLCVEKLKEDLNKIEK